MRKTPDGDGRYNTALNKPWPISANNGPELTLPGTKNFEASTSAAFETLSPEKPRQMAFYVF